MCKEGRGNKELYSRNLSWERPGMKQQLATKIWKSGGSLNRREIDKYVDIKGAYLFPSSWSEWARQIYHPKVVSQ